MVVYVQNILQLFQSLSTSHRSCIQKHIVHGRGVVGTGSIFFLLEYSSFCTAYYCVPPIYYVLVSMCINMAI